MNYFPQFEYQTPPGFVDEVYIHAFNGTNTPLLGVTLAAGASIPGGIPLVLDGDAPFLFGGVYLLGSAFAFTARLKDPFGNYLSDDYVLCQDLRAAVVEPMILCPAGGVFYLYLTNPKGFDQTTPAIILAGAKRYPEVRCE